jgi:hypothetical protein
VSDFTISLFGTADKEKVREAFEIAVRAVRGALAEAGLGGELVLDGVTYPADDVTDELAGGAAHHADEDDGEDDEQDDRPADAAGDQDEPVE